MQGQRSTIGSLPDSLNFDYGSPSTNVGVDQQICPNNIRNPAESRLSDYRISANNPDGTYIGCISQEGRNLDERFTQSGWPTPNNTSFGVGLRLDVQQHEPANLALESGVNFNLSTTQTVTTPVFVRGSSSSSASQNFDLNVARFHRVGDEMDCPNSSKAIGFESRFHNSVGSSSDPFASSSGNNGRFLVEDDDSRPGCSLNGRRLSCKRKTIEGNAGQSSSGGSSFGGAEETMWQAISPSFDLGNNMNINATPESSTNITLPEQVNPRLGLGISGQVPSNNASSLNVPSGIESSYRSRHSRANLSIQQDPMSNNSFVPVPTIVTRHPHVSSVHQPLRFVPIDPPVDLMSQNQSTLLRAPMMRRNVQSHRSYIQRPGSLSSAAVSLERDGLLPADSSSRNVPRNIGEHPMFTPLVDARNSASHPTNWSLNSGSVGVSRNSGLSSHSGSTAESHSSEEPTWASHRHSPSHYSRRLSEYVRRSLMSVDGSDTAGQSSSNSQHRAVPVSSQDGVFPSSGGNPGHNRSHSRLASWLERQGDGAGGIPYLRALAAAGEGRSRLVSEIRNALDVIRRGEGLRIEDVMLLDQSVFFGMADIQDQHREMRLDVDNMSYEELLALEERIGYVCTGLSEEKILKCMKQRKHVHTMNEDVTFAEPCCVCQEEYKDGEDIGTLDCGHDFHRECIKQWLTQKNLCPICKTTGLAT